MTNGLFSLRKILKNSKKKKFHKKKYIEKIFKYKKKKNPLGKAAQAKGLVLSKVEIEAKQPNSGKRKCVKIQLKKNGKKLTVFCPNDGLIKKIEEHDSVLIEGIGGMKGGSFGDLPGIKYKVIKINDISTKKILKKK